MMVRALVTCAIAASLTACGDDVATAPRDSGPADARADVEVDSGPVPREPCNPLSPTGACLLPFPSSYYLRADETTATGHRVDYPREALPANVDGVRID